MTSPSLSGSVIALPDSKRLAGFWDAKVTLDIERFDAIDSRYNELPGKFDYGEFRMRYGRAPRSAEVGCTLSHLAVLQRFHSGPGEASDLHLVAEDDARFSSNFQRVVTAISNARTSADVVILADPYGEADRFDIGSVSAAQASMSLLSMPIACSLGGPFYRVGRFHGNVGGTGLYLVTRRAAGLINQLASDRPNGLPYWVADDWDLFVKKLDLDVWITRPNLASWEGSSVIRPDREVQERTRSPDLYLWTKVRSAIALRTRLGHIPRILEATRHDLMRGRGRRK